MEKLFKYKDYENCSIELHRYSTNNNIALRMVSETEYGEEPITMCTVNTEQKLQDNQVAIKDYSENVGMVDFLKDLNFIESEPVDEIRSCFVSIPVYELTDEAIEYLNKYSYADLNVD